MQAERAAPPTVIPVVCEGVEYSSQGKGLLVAQKLTKLSSSSSILTQNSSSSKQILSKKSIDPSIKKELLWKIPVYKVEYNEKLEKDVQDVFIKSLEVSKDGTAILVTNELDAIFSVDIKSQNVTAMKEGRTPKFKKIAPSSSIRMMQRRPPPKAVTPLIHNGIEYSSFGMGFLIAKPIGDANKVLWQIPVYKVKYNENLEKDVQDIYIKSLNLSKDGSCIEVQDERANLYSVDINTQKVQVLKKNKPTTSFNAPTMICSSRTLPKQVAPIEHEGIKYKKEGMEYIIATKIEGNEKIWKTQVYKIEFKKNLETDVQEVHINSMKLSNDKTCLVVKNEKGQKFKVDLKAGSVTKL